MSDENDGAEVLFYSAWWVLHLLVTAAILIAILRWVL